MVGLIFSHCHSPVVVSYPFWRSNLLILYTIFWPGLAEYSPPWIRATINASTPPTVHLIKSVIDRNGTTCRNSNRLDTQPFWTPLEHGVDRRTTLPYYLPCFAVDNKGRRKYFELINWAWIDEVLHLGWGWLWSSQHLLVIHNTFCGAQLSSALSQPLDGSLMIFLKKQCHVQSFR